MSYYTTIFFKFIYWCWPYPITIIFWSFAAFTLHAPKQRQTPLGVRTWEGIWPWAEAAAASPTTPPPPPRSIQGGSSARKRDTGITGSATGVSDDYRLRVSLCTSMLLDTSSPSAAMRCPHAAAVARLVRLVPRLGEVPPLVRIAAALRNPRLFSSASFSFSFCATRSDSGENR